jgi:hypothetical protein
VVARNVGTGTLDSIAPPPGQDQEKASGKGMQKRQAAEARGMATGRDTRC